MSDTPNPRFALTGGPGGGKTTLLEALAARGHRCVPEVARAIIRDRLAAGLAPRPAPEEFARLIFERDLQNYAASSPGELTFFDRSAVDSMAMRVEAGSIERADAREELRRHPYNPRVFLLPPWREIYRNDAERDQSFEQAIRVFEGLRSWYEACGYEGVVVPPGTVEERVGFLLSVAQPSSKMS